MARVVSPWLAGVALVAAVVGIAACTQASDEAPPVEIHRELPKIPEPAPEPDPEPEPEPEPDTVIEVAGAEPDIEPNTVPIAPLEATPATLEWRAQATLDLHPQFIPVATGVIAQAGDEAWALDADGVLGPRPGLSLPATPLLGHWPDDVWTVTAQAQDAPEGQGQDEAPRFAYELQRFDDKAGAWERVDVGRKPSFVGEANAVRKGWHGGMLVREGSQLTRVGSRKSEPKIGMRMGKLVVDTVESNAGLIYSVSLRPTGLYVQGQCFNMTCVNETAKKLPFGTTWQFFEQLPRQRKSVTIHASAPVEGVDAHHLLHFEAGGWKLESLVHPPTGMWANDEGGLWLVTGDQLRYRSSRGDWHLIELPEGASGLSAALEPKRRELWIAVIIADKTQLLTTPATPAALE